MMTFLKIVALCAVQALAYDDASLMQQNLGVEAGTSAREKFNAIVDTMKKARESFPPQPKLREMALDGLMNDLSEETDQADINQLYTQIHSLLDQIISALQGQKTTAQTQLDAREEIISDCNTEGEAQDDTHAADFETAMEAHRACRGEEDTARGDAETDCGTMTTEMAARKAGTNIYNDDTNNPYNDGGDYTLTCNKFQTNIGAIATKASRPESGDSTTILDHSSIKDLIIEPTDGTNWYKQLTNIVYWYAKVESALGPLFANCEADLHTYAQKRVECHTKQRAQEAAYCTHKQTRQSTCDNRDQCYTTQTGNYETLWTTQLPIANKRTEEGKMVRYVKCLISLLESNSTDKSSCDTTQEDQAFLDQAQADFNISRFSIPVKATCNETNIADFPADDNWRLAYFSFALQGSRTPYNDDRVVSQCCSSQVDDHATCLSTHNL